LISISIRIRKWTTQRLFLVVIIRPFYGLEVEGFKYLLPKHIYVNMSQIQGSFLDKNMASILKIILSCDSYYQSLCMTSECLLFSFKS